MKILMISVAVVLLGVVLFIAGGVRKYKAHFKTMTPVITGELMPGVWAIQTEFVNSYIIKTGDEYIAVDAGNKKELLEQELKKLNIKPSQVKKLFLTHSDYDHVGGVELYSDAQLYLLKEETALLDGSAQRGPFMKNSLDLPFTIVEDGETVMSGDTKVEVIATIGHTSGSVSYLIDDKYLFVGDILKIKEGKGELFIPDFNMDNERLRESLKKLKKRDVDVVFTGHFGFSTSPSILWQGVDE